MSDSRPMDDTARTIVVAGATGLVGSACVRRLLADPAIARVVAPTRRPLPPRIWASEGAERLAEHLVDFDRLDEHPELFRGNAVICALGTTRRKAGSKDAFRTVDHDYPLAIGRLARAGGVPHYLLVSAIGADPDSPFFYSRVKGEVEAGLRDLAFERLTIVRPSLLLGPRNEFRLGEEMMKKLRFLLPARYRAVDADDVAEVLVDAVRSPIPGEQVIESAEIRRRARAITGE